MHGTLWGEQTLNLYRVCFVHIFNQKTPFTVCKQFKAIRATNKWWGSECCWWRVGWWAVASALRTPPSVLPSEGRKLAGFIVPSTIDSTNLLCTSATARNKLSNSLEFCPHYELQQDTLGIWPEPSLTFLIAVIFIWWEWEQCYCQVWCRFTRNYEFYFAKVKDHYRDSD